MTFPSPFGGGDAPALDAVAEATAYDRQTVNGLASKMVGALAEETLADKRKLVGIKGKMMRQVGAPTKKDRANVFNPIVNKMLDGLQTSYQNDDAELMLLLPRLGAAAAQTTAPPGFTVVPAPGAGSASTPPTSAPAPGTCWPDPSRPGCYFCFDGHSLASWCPGDAPPGVPSPTPPPVPTPDPGPIPVPMPDPGPVPYPVPPPIPPPAVCPPCAPDGTPVGQPSACQVGLPEGVTPQAVYIVPWLDPATAGASTASECGQKAYREAMGLLYPAADLAAALARPGGWAEYLGPIRVPGPNTYLLGR